MSLHLPEKQYTKFKIISLSLLFVIFAGLIFKGGIDLKFKVEGNPKHAQLFYDWGSGYSEAQSNRAAYKNDEVKLKLKLRGRDLRKLRFDPVEAEGEYLIKGLRVEVNGILLKAYQPEELYALLQNINMPVVELKENALAITCVGNDPVFELADAFTRELFDLLLRTIGMEFLLAIIVILAAYILLGVKKVRAFVEKIRFTVEKQIKPYDFRWNWKAALCGSVHFLFSFWFQHIVFVFEGVSLANIIICQILFYGLLLFGWHKLFTIVRKVVNGDKLTLEYLKYVAIYFFILMAVLILIWPGYFVSDEWIMIYGAKRWVIASAYHFLIMLQLILSMMLIPAAAGIEIVQAFFISLVVGYVIFQITQRIKSKKWIWLLYIPLVYPAVLLNNFQLQKGMPGTYIEILLLAKMIFALWDKRKLNSKDLIEWVILTAITLTLRMEGIYYIVVAPIVLVIAFKKQLPKYFAICFAVGVIFLGAVLNQIQNSGVGNFYTIVNLNRLIYAPIKAADINKDKKELEKIGKVIDIDAYLSSANVDEAVEKQDPVIFQASDEDVSAYKRGALVLTLKHFPAYFLQQMERFIMSSGFKYFSKTELGGDINNYQNADIYELNFVYGQYLAELFQHTLDVPINDRVRMGVINFMQGRSMDDWHKILITAPIFGNLIVPILFLLMACVYFIKKRKYELLAILLLFMFRLPMLVGLASYVSFQYYLRIFLVGNCIPWMYAFAKLTKLEVDPQ